MSGNAKRRSGGGGAAAFSAKDNVTKHSVTAASSQPRCCICDARRAFCCRLCRRIKHRVQTYPLPGFDLADPDSGDLLTGGNDSIWCIEQIPPTPAVLTEGEA